MISYRKILLALLAILAKGMLESSVRFSLNYVGSVVVGNPQPFGILTSG